MTVNHHILVAVMCNTVNSVNTSKCAKHRGNLWAWQNMEEMDRFASKAHYNLIKKQLKLAIPVSEIGNRQKTHTYMHTHACICVHDMCGQISMWGWGRVVLLAFLKDFLQEIINRISQD